MLVTTPVNVIKDLMGMDSTAQVSQYSFELFTAIMNNLIVEEVL